MAIAFGRAVQPGLQQQWGLLEMPVVDPFGNRIVFAGYRDHLKHRDGSLR